MQIKTDYLVSSTSRLNVLGLPNFTPTEITFHNTYNDAPAINEVKNVYNNSTGTSFHTAVDDKEVQQVMPFNWSAWHSGDGGSGAGNRKSIGVEICYSMSGGPRYRKAELNAIDHISDLMVRFGIPISKVKTHQERNGKYCPHRMLDEGRVAWFKNECDKAYKKKLAGGSIESPIKEEPKVKNQIYSGGYGAEKIVDIVGAMNSVHVTGIFTLKSDKYLYLLTDPTSDTQLKAMQDYLKRNNFWYEMR
ncbi:N-acetylmuramoyl-L-alanine amidase [Bacillus phage BC-7]|nr:N-acetylmuramoyl-L-alanine amidase [Bacillus phage BC-7]